MLVKLTDLLIGNPTPSELPDLIKLTEGVYTKATLSPLSKKLVPCKPLRQLAIEYLTYLGIEVLPSNCDKDYNESKTTQVPTGRVIGVKVPQQGSNILQKIVDINFGYDGKYISFEYKEII